MIPSKRKTDMKIHCLTRTCLSLILMLSASLLMAATPNVIIILADDMGSGDVQAYNPDSGIPTPNLDRLGHSVHPLA